MIKLISVDDVKLPVTECVTAVAFCAVTTYEYMTTTTNDPHETIPHERE